jgi:hypothetical protein
VVLQRPRQSLCASWIGGRERHAGAALGRRSWGRRIGEGGARDERQGESETEQAAHRFLLA